MNDGLADGALNTLYQHDRWATQQLLAVCKTLTDEQLDRPFDMGLGSLRKTLTHMIAVIDGWHSAVTGKPKQFETAVPQTLDALAAAFIRVSDAFGKTLEAGQDGDVWIARRKDRGELSAPRSTLATHVLTHGTHHRAQALNMLRHLGVDPLPQSSVVEWMHATEAAQTLS